MDKPDHALLDKMTACISASDEIYHPSCFWDRLNREHLDLLDRHGLNNFKRTANQRYFNFLPMHRNDPQLDRLLRWWLKNPSLRIFFSRFYPEGLDLFFCSPTAIDFKLRRIRRRLVYRFFVTLLWEYTRANDAFSILEECEEPLFGSPFMIRYRGKWISQDLCHSVLEYNSIFRNTEPFGKDKIVISELGAGGGRMGYLLMKARACRYIDFDIPPALYVAMYYLSKCFPDKNIFRFRKFDNFDEIKDELNEADIAFFTPNQMELFPDNYFDLSINISSMGEMKMDQIANFMNLIDRTTMGYFFTKQWIRSINSEDGVEIAESDYPVPASWKKVFHRNHPVVPGFFEALYRIG